MGAKYSVDGGRTWVEAPGGIRFALEDVWVPGEDEKGAVEFNFTEEGIITDIWVTREEHLDHNIATKSELYMDLMGDMIDDDA